MQGVGRRKVSTEIAVSTPKIGRPHALMTPMPAPLVKTADEGRTRKGIDPLVIVVLLLVTLASLAVAAWSLASNSPPVTGTLGSPSAPPSTVPSTASPGEDVAGSNAEVTGFDLLPTGSEVEGWSLSEGARLQVAAMPTAVDRSARLDGAGLASACRDLGAVLSVFDVRFMLDAVPAGGVTLLSLELDDGSDRQVWLSEGNLTVGPIGDAVELEAETWYRWVVRSTDDEVRMSLRSADDSSLAEAVAAGHDSGAQATEFCMTTVASSRLYLNEMNLETP